MSEKFDLLTEQRIAIVCYLLDLLERGSSLPADPSNPEEVSLILVAQASGLAPEVMLKRANRNLVESWSDTLGVRPVSDC